MKEDNKKKTTKTYKYYTYYIYTFWFQCAEQEVPSDFVF